MADIKRYQPDVVYARYGGGRDHVLHEHTNGDYVLYSDHLAALEAAVVAALADPNAKLEEEMLRLQALRKAGKMAEPFTIWTHLNSIHNTIRARGAAHD